jgi:arsenate reductase
MGVKFYHNPECSKSRQAMDVLEDAGVDMDVIHYLEGHLTPDMVHELLTRIENPVEDVVRDKAMSTEDIRVLAEEIAKNPEKLQRPIVDTGEKALVGRPVVNIHPWLIENKIIKE